MMYSKAMKLLQELQSEHPQLRPNIDVLKENSQTFERANLATQQLQLDRATLLISDLRCALPDALLQLLDNGSLAVGEIGLETPNAYYQQVEKDQFLVIMHSGLFEFLYRIARPLAAAVFRTNESPNSGVESPDFARIVAEIIWWQLEGGSSFGPEYEITTDQRRLAELLTTFAEKFLLAHELGHVLVALERKSNADFNDESDTGEELIADWAAVKLTLTALYKVQENPDPMYVSLVYAGAELALQIWGVMESIGLNFVDSVHPPTNHRLKMLRGEFRAYCPSDDVFNSLMTVAIIIEKTFRQVSNIILDPSEHAEKFEEETKSLICEIEQLLEECSANTVPDYVTFYKKSPTLFSRGYPHEILSQVFEKITADFAAMSAEEPTLHLDTTTQRRFNKFKLLFGLTNEMPEPAKALYQAAFNRLRRTD